MNGNSKSKNVKIPIELEELVKKRAPDTPPGETLLAVYKEYEKLEELAKCVSDNTDQSKPVYDMMLSYMDKWDRKFEASQTSITELKAMLQGLQLFFTKIKSP